MQVDATSVKVADVDRAGVAGYVAARECLPAVMAVASPMGLLAIRRPSHPPET